ncbi:MAG: hypothetical protein M3Q30_16480 [Actinomycetota bacterium]|nr:hypothetical protein [Actinomycetota bacterium]
MAAPRIGYWIPGIVGGPVLVANSESAAIVVSHLEVFPDGIEMPIAVYVREPEAFEEQVSDREPDRRWVMRTRPWRLDFFARFGIAFTVDFPDGTRLSVDEPYVPTPEPSKPPRDAARAGIDRGSGFGNGGHHQTHLFLWPLPGPGVLRLTCAWPDQQIVETAADLDGATINQAAARSTSAWRDDVRRLEL